MTFNQQLQGGRALPERLRSHRSVEGDGPRGRRCPRPAPRAAAASLPPRDVAGGTAALRVRPPGGSHSRSAGEEVGLGRVHLRHPRPVLHPADGQAAARSAAAGGEWNGNVPGPRGWPVVRPRPLAPPRVTLSSSHIDCCLSNPLTARRVPPTPHSLVTCFLWAFQWPCRAWEGNPVDEKS